MGYNSKHTLILSSEEGYNKVFDQYKKYHKHLDSFYDLDIQRFLPRDTERLDVVDLGSGDGRLYKHFDNIKLNSYTACDIADKLLDQHPKGKNKVNNVVCDLEQKLPFEDDSFDLAMSFFVIEHIGDLNSFFEETYRSLRSGGKFIIGHFLQRREFEWNIGTKDKNERFKIKQYRYKLEDIQEAAEYNFFDFHYQEIVDPGNKKTLLGYLIICEKN